jgi:hypothetical protein
VNRFAALANRQVQIDVATFVQWVNARQEHRAQLVDFYRARFRDEFEPAFGSERAKEANQRADNYMLAVVLFASALFFAGISTKLELLNARRAVLGLGWVLFLGTVILLATFPVQLTT